MKDVFHEAASELERERPVVVATVVHTKGSTPQKPGAKLLVRNDGSGVGTWGADASRATSGSRRTSS